MSSEAETRVTTQDIEKVQNLIEGCLKQYMTKKEVVNTLHSEARIPPTFTELVWQKLEQENHTFFRVYNVNLVVIQHIMAFNRLLEKQAEKMHEHFSTTTIPVSFSNGSDASSLVGMRYLHEATTLRSDYANGISSHILGEVPTSNPEFPFYNGSSLLHEQSTIGDEQIQNYFGGLNQDLNDQIIDSTSTFGSLDQIPPNFSSTSFTDRFTLGIQESFDNLSLPSESNYSESARRE